MDYTVRTVDGCTLIFGSVPMMQMVGLSKSAGRGAVLGLHLARLAGASFAIGQPDKVKALEQKLEAQAREHAKRRPNGLPEALEIWIAAGQHGNSSVALFECLSGFRLNGRAEPAKTAHPHDPDDLRRCVQMLEQCPELRAELPKASALSPEWARLVARWDELTQSLREEMEAAATPARKSKAQPASAEKTYKLMREILADG